MKTLGEYLKEHRVSAGLSQAQLANMLNVDRTTIAKYETNVNLPDINMLCKMAEIFDTSIDELIGRNKY